MNIRSLEAIDAVGPEASMRRDGNGRWHRVGSAPCEGCGCLYDYSIDELGIVWEAGPSTEADCSDPRCDCHVTPIVGSPFHVNVTPVRRGAA